MTCIEFIKTFQNKRDIRKHLKRKTPKGPLETVYLNNRHYPTKEI